MTVGQVAPVGLRNVAVEPVDELCRGAYEGMAARFVPAVEPSLGYCVSRMTKSPPGDVALSKASSFSRVGAASPRSYRA